jgi:parvulin-like peptidyl-prolyl isomerase
MVKAFGDVSFSLEGDEVGMAAYDPVESRYGWHVIKRLDRP